MKSTKDVHKEKIILGAWELYIQKKGKIVSLLTPVSKEQTLFALTITNFIYVGLRQLILLLGLEQRQINPILEALLYWLGLYIVLNSYRAYVRRELKPFYKKYLKLDFEKQNEVDTNLCLRQQHRRHIPTIIFGGWIVLLCLYMLFTSK